MNPPTPDPISEIHEIRRNITARFGNDPHRHGDYLRLRAKEHPQRIVRVRKNVVSVREDGVA